MSRSKDAWAHHPTVSLATSEELLPMQAPDLLYFLDTETTGLSRTSDRVVEIAFVCIDRRTRKLVWEASTLLNPHFAMPAGATAVNGIKTSDVQFAPDFVDVWPRIVAKVPPGSKVVAHNAPFDRSMIAAECGRTRFPPPEWDWEDSRTIARKVAPGYSHKLQDLRDLFRTPGGTAHRAKGDAQTLSHLYFAMVDRHADEQARAIRDAAPLLARKAAA
jgi:DNA polymerase-3 subunit epsilon